MNRFFESRLVQLIVAFVGLVVPYYLLQVTAPRTAVDDLPLEREALVVYYGPEVENPRRWWGIDAVRGPLERCGFTVRQVAHDEIRPGRDDRAGVYVLCFGGKRVKGASAYVDLALDARRRGAKVVMLGDPTAFFDDLGGFNSYNRLLNLCGMEDRGGFLPEPAGMTVEAADGFFDEAFTAAEVRATATWFRHLFPLSAEARPLVEAQLGGRRFVPVAVTPEGGYAMNPFLFKEKGGKWRPLLDLQKFLAAALDGPAAVPPAGAARTFDRRALVLVSSREAGWRMNIFRRFAQLPLNFNGYDFEFLDVEGRAKIEPSRRYGLVVTAFQTPTHANYEAILEFLVKCEAEKYIFLLNLPVYDEKGECPNWPLVVSFFQKFQVQFSGYTKYDANLTLETACVYYPFESSFSRTAETMVGKLVPLHEVTPLLSFRDARALYTPAFMDERALFMIGDFLYDWRSDALYLNLFELFRAFLAPPVVPLWQYGHGPRLFFAHVDGDGLVNTNESTPDVLGGERCLELIASRNLPCSTSFIVREILDRRGGRPYTLELARRFAALPNVEPASHTLNHPLHWEAHSGEVSLEEDHPPDEVREDMYALKMVEDPRAEIEESVDWIARLFPGAPRLLFWSGDCMPSEAQLRRARLAGIANLNGGDTRRDAEWPHYTFTAPPYSRIGREVQVHTGAANEMPFTNLWSGPHDGFARVIDTLENTGREPYVVAPANIYYHFYSGERDDAFAALGRVYDWAERKELSPLFASEYVALVHDFIACRVETGTGEATLRNAGRLRAAKVAKAAFPGRPDLTRSEGILGFDDAGAYWLALLDASGKHTLRFAESPAPVPHVRRSTHPPERFADGDRTVWRCRGFGKFRLVLAGLEGRSWRADLLDGTGRSFDIEGTDAVDLRSEIRGELVVKLSPR